MKDLMSYAVLLVEMSRPGRKSPIEVERAVLRMQAKVTMGICSLLNQLRATLLGVLRMKMVPMAPTSDPERQRYGF